MAEKLSIPLPAYNRLSMYLTCLKRRPATAAANISATAIAEELGINDVVVRKDLASISSGGKPKIGYIIEDLIRDIEHALGHDTAAEAVLVGAGNLGKALLAYSNFEKYGLNVVAAFDSNPNLIGKEIQGTKIVDPARIQDLCERMHIKIGIITVPFDSAQTVCDALVAGGIRAIWNFAPIHLKVPENVVIKNENMAASLAFLTKQLEESIAKDNSN